MNISQSNSEDALRIKLGIITPSYERPELVERLHLSLLIGNSYVDWLHCVVNDGSTIDYSHAVARCESKSGRLVFTRIDNSGALIARNVAIELAAREGCTHLVFVDDDDELTPGALAAIVQTITNYQHVNWFVFPSIKNRLQDTLWPTENHVVSWFHDIVLRKIIGNDNLIVISTSLVGSSRFSRWGRNQREWKFLLKIAKSDDRVMICPEPLLIHNYVPGGLTDQARKKSASPLQIANALDRAISYWFMSPGSVSLLLFALSQIVISPVKFCRFFIWKIFSNRKN